MKRVREEVLDAEGRRVRHDAAAVRMAFVVSRFNRQVTRRLLDGALACIAHHGGDPRAATLVHVPGSWELQLAAKKLAASGRHDAVVALGALIRGETSHFEVLAHQVARGLAQVSLETSVPVIFGVLTTDTLDQALARSADGSENKGWEATLAAIEMVDLCRRLG